MSPKHNFKTEEEGMLRAGVIKPVSSAWTLPVLIPTKKSGNPKVCVDYRLLNQIMVADRWQTPRAQELFDGMQGNVIFTGLYFLPVNWQI